MGEKNVMKLLVLSCLVAVSFAQCPAGHNNKQSAVSTKCSSNAKSCTVASCCTVKTGTCAAAGVVCDAGFFVDPGKKFNQAGTTAAEKKKNCCSAQATCADVKCPAGHENTQSTSGSSPKCAGLVSACASRWPPCCKAKTGTCAAEASNICTR